MHAALFDLLGANLFLDNFRYCDYVKNVKFDTFDTGLCHFLQISFSLAVVKVTSVTLSHCFAFWPV